MPTFPFPAGRSCLLCPAILSRFTEGDVCGPCEVANRALFPPLVYFGSETDPNAWIGYRKEEVPRGGTYTRRRGTARLIRDMRRGPEGALVR